MKQKVYLNIKTHIKEKTIKQISFAILLSVCFFIAIFILDFFHNFTTTIQQNDLLLAITITLSFFAICLSFFTAAQYIESKKQADVNENLKNKIKKHKTDNLLILDALPAMIYYVDKNFRIFWANKALLEIDKEAIGKFPNDVFRADDLPNQIQQSIESQDIEKNITYYPPNTLHIEETYLENYCIPIIDIDNEISSFLIISIDITEKTQLEESRGRLTAVVESSEDAIFVVDNHRIIHSWNTAAEKMFGYTTNQMVGQPLTILDHYINFETLIEISSKNTLSPNNSIKHLELVKLEKSNSCLYVSITVYPFVDDAGNILGVSAIIRDKTESINAQEALVESEKQMRELALHIDAVREEERKQIAFAIHDELGYALTAIKMDITWLAKRTDLTKISLEERTNSMLRLVDLTIQKVKSLSSNLRPSILDHFGLVAAIEEQAGEFQRRTGIRCKVTIEPDDIVVEERLMTPIFRIFQEALTNITRYAKASRVNVNIRYSGGIFKMDVIDNGIGVPLEKVKAHSSFGLLGIREKAISIGGTATIEGKPNGGTKVSLVLPM